ncbi:hypothetical protein SEA_VERITY_75 [Gordonia phage Verity]|uniref:Uncharacterized protein n=1 Tax=Gordonia phage Verity TaxID=2591211 RepID=A0A514DIW4_9CAUD|nr:hypothetical protein J1776_gp75 [Gordonia phage Verity]QDH93561.1 hypothetical protein SEA_VERITY_75 [Gordonia phage Verity]QPO16918.1 hypothetical protein SEA_DELREY21_75 [Gordonia phage Delrey21]QXN74201.1 hypothetical protein SEA_DOCTORFROGGO_75 [Gordonia phage DoctorFroggo]
MNGDDLLELVVIGIIGANIGVLLFGLGVLVVAL